jgi:alpha-tubulin suppressor-like RCC1 family protein
MALKGDGTVWVWGYNGDGELGDGTTATRPIPGAVTGLSGIQAIAAGRAFCLALA